MKREFRNFEDARKFVHDLKLMSQREWHQYAKSGNKPEDIPTDTYHIYKNKGWINWGDWLCTGTVANFNKEYKSFDDARKFVHILGLKSQKEWLDYTKSSNKPDDIPSTPHKIYKNKGWKNMGDWLGTGTVAPKNRTFFTFEKAKKIVQSLGLKNATDWKIFSKSGNKPNEIPSHPHVIYKNKGWISMGDWLGSGTIQPQQRQYYEFSKARKIIQSKNLKSRAEWRKYTKDLKFPKELPKAPDQYYKNKGWISMGDWLGSGTIQPQLMEQWSFDKARSFAQKLELKSGAEWRKYSQSKEKPNKLPASPDKVYKNKGWISMGDWLGTGTLSPQERSKNFLSYSDAKKIIHELSKKHNIRTNKDWRSAGKKGLIPDNIPSTPWAIYSKKRKRNEKAV